MGKAKTNIAEKKMKLRLPRISGKCEAVFVSVGNRSWRIKRGCDVEVPECAYDVLRNAELAEDAAVAYIENL